LAEVSLHAQIPHNHCFGCGPAITAGLNLRQFLDWIGRLCGQFAPQLQHCAAAMSAVRSRESEMKEQEM